MKQALIAWFAARLVEKSSAAGITVMVSSGFQEYSIIQHTPLDIHTAAFAAVGILAGAAAFVMKDGHILEAFGFRADGK